MKTLDGHRRAIVLVSDGDDTSSMTRFIDVLNLAKRSEAAIYTIILSEDARGMRKSGFVLGKLAEETAGRMFLPRSAGALVAPCSRDYDRPYGVKLLSDA